MPASFVTAGDVHTAAEYNMLPRGVVAYASSTTSYNVTASTVISTGMTATWTATAGRRYKITYYEPQVLTPTVDNGFVAASIRVTNAAGAVQTLVYAQTNTGDAYTVGLVATAIIAPGAGSLTYVGCSIASTTTGTPALVRSADAPAFILVEDIGAA